jgi:protein-disulfide isomerase
MDFSALPASAQAQLAKVLSDEFCYCGCPHALGQCLKTHPECRHAKRAAALAANAAREGSHAVEIGNGLSNHYLSYRQPRVKVPVDDRLCRGPKSAPVQLAVFSDFECPYCAAARPVLDRFQAAHADRVRLCFMPFPLDSHPNAVIATQAALFARDQGKFWPMHDAIFANQTTLGRAKLVELAKAVGLDGAGLHKTLEGGKYLDEVERFRQAGRAVGLDSTPTVFLNGRKTTLGLSDAMLAHQLEDELELLANGNTWMKD